MNDVMRNLWCHLLRWKTQLLFQRIQLPLQRSKLLLPRSHIWLSAPDLDDEEDSVSEVSYAVGKNLEGRTSL